MKIILVKDIPQLGRSGDVKEVSEGYARNFLFVRKLALPATSQALAQIQKENLEKQEKLKHQQERFLEIKNRLGSRTFTVLGKANKQTLFAAIRQAQVADAINEALDLALTPKQVIIKQAIKSLGLTQVEIKLTDTIHAEVKLEVKAQ